MAHTNLMIIPVRCFTCGTIVGDKWEKYEQMRTEDPERNVAEILDELGLKKVCCRRMIISQVNLIDTILPYQQER